uniref:Proline dehydrogenase n=1 Tax=Sinocyclocheilus anshuiensis TaxID=1608454 RepID=A0A671LME5_9TELE
MTALGRPQFLRQFSKVLVKWRCFFSFLAVKQGKDGVEVLEQKLDLEQLQTCLARLGNYFPNENAPICVHMLNFFRFCILFFEQTGQLEPLLSKFTEEEERQMKRMHQRLDVLAKHAVENGVRLMVDQTHLEMKRIFNRDKAVVFNTYQCYLKEAFDNVSMDVELSRREGWCFGAKVRGAYMYQERSRAAEIGYEDLINPEYESTNRMYQRCLDYVLMNEMGLAPTDKKVYFSQLLGMCDQISFPLGEHTHTHTHVCTCVTYGPVNEVITYLSRRAQENRGIMKGVQMERELLWKELMRRLTSGEVFYTPAV